MILFHVTLQVLHSLAPERFIVPEPIVDRSQGFGVQTTKARSRAGIRAPRWRGPNASIRRRSLPSSCVIRRPFGRGTGEISRHATAGPDGAGRAVTPQHPSAGVGCLESFAWTVAPSSPLLLSEGRSGLPSAAPPSPPPPSSRGRPNHGVHDDRSTRSRSPRSAFTMRRSRRSRSADLAVHDGPKPARCGGAGMISSPTWGVNALAAGPWSTGMTG